MGKLNYHPACGQMTDEEKGLGRVDGRHIAFIKAVELI